MSVETEIKAAEQEVVSTAEKIEAAVASDVKKAEDEVKSVAESIATEAKADSANIEAKVKAELVKIVADEKLYLREAELEYLKAQMEIQRLSKITEAKSKQYTEYVEQLFVKYGLDKAEYVFDGAVAVFKKLEAKL